MNIITVSIGRIDIHLAELTAQQVSNVFGVIPLTNIERPELPQGTTQEEAILGSPEYKQQYDRYVAEQYRAEFIGMLAHARDPILWQLSYDENDPLYMDYMEQSIKIAQMCDKLGFMHDQRYIDDMIDGERIVFLAEKSFTYFPEASKKLADYVNDCLRRVGYIGGDAIQAEIKSEESDVSGDTPAGTGVDGAGEAQDALREAQPVARGELLGESSEGQNQ